MLNGWTLSMASPAMKRLLLLFLLVLCIGFFTGIRFVHFTTDAKPEGISENYLGNEDDDSAKVMKFKKSQHQILNILHTHFLSLSVVFLILGILIFLSSTPSFWKSFLMLEPLVSVLFTFGGIYFVWLGYKWMSYVVMVSGILMTLSFVLSVGFVVKDLVSSTKHTDTQPSSSYK